MQNHELASSLRTVISKLFAKLRQKINMVDSLSLTEISTLSNLYNYQSLFPSQMAEMVNIKTQSMSQVINRLEEFNLIAKTPSETDKRKVAISLSATGKKQVEITRYERDQWLDAAIENHLSAAEKKTLTDAILILEKLAEIR